MKKRASFQKLSFADSFLFCVSFLMISTMVSFTMTSNNTSADTNASVSTPATVTVASACTLTGGSSGTSITDNTYVMDIDPGTSQEMAGDRLGVVCNDTDGYALYAIGYSGDNFTSPTNTQLIGTHGNISTNTSGSSSYWAMKLSAVSGVTAPTITNSFDSYHVIPSDYTKIASYGSSTASISATGASVQTNYKVSISSAQIADSYIGKVKYTLVHPSTAPAPAKPVGLCTDAATCMQQTNACDTTLTDARDGKQYTVATINGQCWMTQNLLATGVLQSQYSNFDNVTSWNVSAGDLDSTITSDAHTYTAARIHEGTDRAGNPTVWYNFCAASAGYNHGCDTKAPYSAGTGEITGDICPRGWRLPTIDEYTGITDYMATFLPAKGGNWYNGALTSATSGYYWSSTSYPDLNYRQYYFIVNSSNVASTTQNNTRRGEYLRCVRNS